VLSWSAPASDGGSAVTGYKVYRGTSSGGEALWANLGSTATSWTDASASNGVTYYYQVSAVNSVGEGSRSGERSATPSAPASVPGAPTLNSATGGSGSVALSWSAPSSDGGSAITGYRIYRANVTGGETVLTTVGNVTSWTDTSVANGTTYYYQVSAVNSVGEGFRSNERSATATASATVPGAPTLNSASAGNGSVALSWSAPTSNGGSAITAYKVYRGTSAGNESLYANLGSTATSWTDGNASNGVTYYYQVSAVNSVGEGFRSGERSATPSAPATVPGAPTLNSAAPGNGSVTLSWSAPSSDGGSAVTGYKVYRGTSSGGEALYANLGGTATSWADGNASNGVTYYYQVSAVNSVGEGSRSGERSATPSAPANVPGSPTLNSATAGNGSVTLSWSAPTSNGGSAITGYKVYRGTSSGAEALYANLGSTATNWADGNATNGVTYHYQVSAVNSVGEGSRSNERSATPTAPATVPGAPTLNSAAPGNGSVTLSWSAPSSDGGSAITGYKVYRGTSSGAEALYANLGSTATSWIDGNATNGVTYYYQVTAVNSVGEGSRSGERSATPSAPATAPGAPALNSATGSEGSIALAWSAPASDGGSAITGYRIYRGSTSGGETVLTTTSGPTTSFTDTGVGAGATYYYQVSAVNSVGEGPRSGERSATTPATGDSIAPSTPYNMTTLLTGTTQVVIDWANSTDNVGVTGYQVYRDGSFVGTVTTSWFIDSDLAASTTHTYQVRAVDAAGNRSAASITLSATTTAYGIFDTLGSLAGVVFNANGDVVSNAVVKVGTNKSTRTNSSGVWMFVIMPAGNWSVTATSTSSATVPMTAIGKQTVIAAIVLP
jgi:fibronectin type 3 domain-containing protein